MSAPRSRQKRSSLDEVKRNPGREMGVSPDFIRATTVCQVVRELLSHGDIDLTQIFA
jgi:hypothetical protein